MPEYRVDPVSKYSVIVATDRMARPGAVATSAWPNPEPDCPFCRGKENETPEEVALYPSGASNDDWQVRVVPNKYPALSRELSKRDEQTSSHFTASQPARGFHEVVIECPDHLRDPEELSANQLRLVLDAYAGRMQWMSRQEGIRYVSVFKNYGPAAGASLPHAHSQIMGLDRIPPAISREIQSCSEFHKQTGNCLFCEILQHEVADHCRIVDETDDFAVWCPYASRLPYEWWIVPKRHAARFDQTEQSERAALSLVLRDSLIRLARLADHVPFNFYVHSAPFDTLTDEHYHWHIECLPRLARRAGFEWGTDIHINPVSPEQAAARLRSFQP
ncbi:MAG: galactose-1-phosphate uridylyltransferase [Planctomycetota bacterium]